jgi:hypothetical protein
MAGTLTISTLSDGTYTTSTTNLVRAPCTAWVNFNGASGASPVIRGSYNMSSVTRNGTGDYTLTYTNAMTDANYSVTGMGQFNAGGDIYGALIMCLTASISPPITTTTARIKTMYASGSGSQVDCAYGCVSIFR